MNPRPSPSKSFWEGHSFLFFFFFFFFFFSRAYRFESKGDWWKCRGEWGVGGCWGYNGPATIHPHVTGRQIHKRKLEKVESRRRRVLSPIFSFHMYVCMYYIIRGKFAQSAVGGRSCSSRFKFFIHISTPSPASTLAQQLITTYV
jgi:hypothetical protein